MSLVLGIDSSTTGTKAVLLAEDLSVLGVGATEYEYQTPHPLWSEQDPRVWWDATVASIRSVLASTGANAADVVAVGLTGQMHGATLLDAADQVLRPAILWNDQRTAAECDLMRRIVGRERLIAITGNDAQTGFTAAKLLWVRDHEPEVWQRVAHVLLPKDYVRFCLSGDHATDKADGSGMQLFDLAARDWSPELLELLEIDPGRLPASYEGPEVTGVVSMAAAEATGLRAGTPIVAGGGDQACGAVASGAVSVGVVSVSLGTSGVVFATTDGLAIEPQGRVHAFCHAVPGKWHQMGVMLSAAGSLRWLRDALMPGLGYGEITAMAAEVPAGSDGLTFLPYLTGERTPYADPLARGAFVGLTVRHDRRHLARAVLEGVSYGLRDNLELMISTGLPRPAEVRLSGGGARSQLWCQILADTLGVTVVTVDADHAAAQGAALLATVSAGWQPDVESASAAGVTTSPAASPSADRQRYEDGFAVFRGLYPALAPTFHRQSDG